jgi:hypothetical protein
MAVIDGPKYLGPVTFDLNDVKDALVDLPPGGMKGARGEQEGLDEVLTELATAVPGHGEAADVPTTVYQRIVDKTALLGKLRTHEAALEKALEVCKETRVKTENDREDDIGVIAKAVTDAAKRTKDSGVAAPFELTVKYNAQIADKAAQTRRKNAEAKADAAKEPAAPQGASGQGGPPPPA